MAELMEIDAETVAKADTERERQSGGSGREIFKKTKPTFSDPAKLVKFLIGPNATPVHIHKEVAMNKCQAFAAALGKFKEGRTQEYTINDTTEGAFRLLMQWMYSDEVEVAQLQGPWDAWSVDKDPANKPSEEDHMRFKEEDQSLVEGWVLADKYCLPNLQNQIAHSITDICALTSKPPIFQLAYVYKSTPAESPLRKLMLTLTYHHRAAGIADDQSDLYPKQMLFEYMHFMTERHGHAESCDCLPGEHLVDDVRACLVEE